MIEEIARRAYFFHDGIRFECRRCGACCGGDPGTVYVSHAETERIAGFLNISIQSLIEDYLYPFRGSYGIQEHGDGRCLFFKDGCVIYPVRPQQCATFPFWFSNLRSQEQWLRICAACPGIGSGRLYTQDEILSVLASMPAPKA